MSVTLEKSLNAEEDQVKSLLPVGKAGPIVCWPLLDIMLNALC